MAGTNNFLQWNPGAANQESDSAYSGDSMRSSGAASGQIFPSPTANKLFFQVSTMVAALAAAMANKSYNVVDSNLSNLITALGNILTNADIAGNLVRFSDFTGSLTANGWVKLPGGLILAWGLSGNVAGDANSDSVNVTFSSLPSFPGFSNCFMALAVANSVSPGSHGGTVTQVTAKSTASITITMVNADSNNHVGAVAAYWFAIGN